MSDGSIQCVCSVLLVNSITHCCSTGLTVGLLISVISETLMDVINFSSLLSNTPSFFAGTAKKCLVLVVTSDLV